MRTCEKALESKKVEAKDLIWPPEVIFGPFWTMLLKKKVVDISAPQNLISTNGLPMRTYEKALKSTKMEAKDLI